MAQQQAAPAGTGRARTVLTIVIVLLLALLLGLVWVFYNLLKPVGGAKEETTKASMKWVRSIYGFGPSADEQLLSPTSVAIAPNGDIYATDQTRSRIMIFRPDGTFKRLLHTGAGGTGKGQFIRPESVAVGSDGLVYIADPWAKKIIVFDRAGKFVREWPVLDQARGVYVDGDKVYVLDMGTVLVYDKNGKKLAQFAKRGTKPGEIDAYQGIAARDGNIYIADSFNKRLETFSADGKVKWVVPGGVAVHTGPSTDAPEGGDESASKALPDHRWDLPQDVAFDGAGRLIVVDAFQFELAVVDPKTGKVQAKYGDFGREDGQFFYPTSVAYDSRRDWFAIADTQNNRIQIVRIPDSSGSAVSAAWRAVSSPYRYLAVPLVLLLLAIVLAVVVARRMSKASVGPFTDDSTEL